MKNAMYFFIIIFCFDIFIPSSYFFNDIFMYHQLNCCNEKLNVSPFPGAPRWWGFHAGGKTGQYDLNFVIKNVFGQCLFVLVFRNPFSMLIDISYLVCSATLGYASSDRIFSNLKGPNGWKHTSFWPRKIWSRLVNLEFSWFFLFFLLKVS